MIRVSPGNELTVRLTVNEAGHTLRVDPREPLSDVLRHRLGLTGTHVGCEQGVCGCCTILFDGEPARACLVLAVQADGHEIRTVESLTQPDGGLHPLQEAFGRHHALQCGFCTPGQLMNALALLPRAASMSDDDLRGAISGQLCRCTGYTPIVDAIRTAAGDLT
ncbi:(2Fe-2S)-binding protein [Nonomuraea monospora]|uniref:(2Fe-2S)-binding protein n=1 Tax=Nonomuraea monospora TaxID=568818 RepID=A0ABN3D3N0_9ACTN